jgi:hypothetical protein
MAASFLPTLLKDLGLDPGLLTPVSGELSCELFDGKWRITELKNTYSEERRSQFYLHPEEESYMDMDGNLHVNIKVKQETTLKIAEPFTFIVRGNVEKPRYFLK